MRTRRDELNETLEVSKWRLPSGETLHERGGVEDTNAPSWWLGDEDASQSFLTAMGVHLG